jgi:AcrR family transcriptional regulator
MSERREELIGRALDYFLEHGLAGLSLRPLAEHIDTSARLLVYHFGSKEGLIAAVMGEVRARTQKSFAAHAARHARGRRNGVMHAFWIWIIRPANVRYMRLLFEVQVLALQNPDGYARYLEGTSSSWLDLIERSLPPSKDKRAIATLCAAVMDGLLLEYLSTGDRRRTTKALDLFSELVERRGRSAPPTNASTSSGRRSG